MEKFVALLIFIVNYESAQPSVTKLAHGVGKTFVAEELSQDLVLASQKSSFQQQFFTQKLDHFNPSDNRQWQQRYWKSEMFYKPQGPVFLWINDEEPADPGWLTAGQWVVYAKHLGALCFLLEHRFYGESKPTKDTSTENLVYLSSEQAVEDVAEFIKGMKAKDKSLGQAKFIVFGGSYAGSLATWARLKHSDLIYGAVSSSAPLLAIVDFTGYYGSIQSTLAAYNKKCPKAIQTAIDAIKESFKTDAGRKSLTKMFKLCSQIPNTPLGLTHFIVDLAYNIAVLVQYNKDNLDFPTRSITVDKICDLLVREDSPPMTSFAELYSMILKARDISCINPLYEEDIDYMKKVDYESEAVYDRLWWYTVCSEFGFFQTSSRSTDLFGASFTVDFWIQECEDVFGKKFDLKFLEDAVVRTNKNYGGLEINVDNIVFVNGSDDPWQTLGITKVQPGKLYDVVFIKGGAHCSDVYSSSADDSKELKAARKTILNLLRSWINKK